MRRSGLRDARSCPSSSHSGFQPFADQADDALVADTVFDESDQPLVAYRVEEPRNVGVQYPVHLSAADPDREGVQRIVLAASRPEAVGEPEEVFLVDRVEHFHQRALDDLVFQRRNAERAPPSVRFRDVHPP